MLLLHGWARQIEWMKVILTKSPHHNRFFVVHKNSRVKAQGAIKEDDEIPSDMYICEQSHSEKMLETSKPDLDYTYQVSVKSVKTKKQFTPHSF